MNIRSARFIKGVTGSDKLLSDGKFQAAFVGRSNVGKSTLINSLTGKINLARSSSNPGKTIRMDLFLINDYFYFIDFPGYGYAKHSAEIRNNLEKMLLWYLMCGEFPNRVLILIVDAAVGVTKYDADVLKIFREYHINHIVVANKIDKLKMGQKEKQISRIKADSDNSEVITFSSRSKHQSKELMNRILAYAG
jgi:GTP-binding protein